MNTNTELNLSNLVSVIEPSELSKLLKEVAHNYSFLYISKSEDCLPNEELASEIYYLRLLADFFQGKEV